PAGLQNKTRQRSCGLSLELSRYWVHTFRNRRPRRQEPGTTNRNLEPANPEPGTRNLEHRSFDSNMSTRILSASRRSLVLVALLVVAAVSVETQTSVTLQSKTSPATGQSGIHNVAITGS